jgi:hypothetical protein
MKQRLRCRIPAAIATCIIVAALAGCAAAPTTDGGIVGTGNRPACEPQTTKNGTRVPLPPECKPLR